MTKKAVHFGAGNIGRGFVGCFLHQAGYHVVFVDVVAEVIDRLNSQSSYNVIEFGNNATTQKTVTNYSAINSRVDPAKVVDEIASADIVTCSVGDANFKFIAPAIANGIAKRSADQPPVAVIACENKKKNTDGLAELVRKNAPAEALAEFEKKTIYANCEVDRIVPLSKEPTLDVKVEIFHEWVVDSKPFTKAGLTPPEIPAIRWAEEADAFYDRKVYTVNTAHATAAYMGYNRNKATIHDAMADPSIREAVDAAVSETSKYIVQEYPFFKDEQEEYKKTALTRISNPSLHDHVERVGRTPIKKLGREERIIRPAAALAERGIEPRALLVAAEMAFRFQNVEGEPESAELAKIMTEKNADEVVRQVCGLKPEDALYPKLKEVVEKVQADSRD